MEHNQKINSSSSCGSRMRNEKENEAKRSRRMERRTVMENGREDINDLAEAFIKNFRKQLKMQRDESFKRYQEMIARGT